MKNRKDPISPSERAQQSFQQTRPEEWNSMPYTQDWAPRPHHRRKRHRNNRQSKHGLQVDHQRNDAYKPGETATKHPTCGIIQEQKCRTV